MKVKTGGFKAKILQYHAKTYENSFCAIKLFGSPIAPIGLWIEFAGPATRLISKSNKMGILYKFAKGGGKIPYIGKNAEQKGRESALTQLLLEAFVREGISVPRFQTKTDIIATLGAQSGRWDSHNCTKFIGDWLQGLGIINDDSDAEIKCFKKSDYLDDTEILGTTQIIIQPRDQVSMLTEDYIGKVKRASTGYKYIG